MKTLSGRILKLLGWKLKGEFPDIKKSILIFAPHTSYIDAVFGKLYLNEIGIKHNFLSKKGLFFFPMNIIMKKYGGIKLGGNDNTNAVYQVAKIIEENPEMHLVMSPEGTRSKVFRWKKGFVYMAQKANVPIIVGFMDFKKKELGIRGVIYDTSNINKVMSQLNEFYKGISGKHPQKFALNKTKYKK